MALRLFTCRSYLTEGSLEELQGMYHPYQDSAERDVIFYHPLYQVSTKVLVRQDWSDIRLLSRIAISYPAGPISARSPSLSDRLDVIANLNSSLSQMSQ